MYRLKGQVRMFDVEAAFTALDEPVTFGQTNENALPLIRVADVIDEWDGGTITLADGTSGGKHSFGKRSPWADCSGPLVRRGSEPDDLWDRYAGPPVEPQSSERLVRAVLRSAGDEPAILRRVSDAASQGRHGG